MLDKKTIKDAKKGLTKESKATIFLVDTDDATTVLVDGTGTALITMLVLAMTKNPKLFGLLERAVEATTSYQAQKDDKSNKENKEEKEEGGD